MDLSALLNADLGQLSLAPQMGPETAMPPFVNEVSVGGALQVSGNPGLKGDGLGRVKLFRKVFSFSDVGLQSTIKNFGLGFIVRSKPFFSPLGVKPYPPHLVFENHPSIFSFLSRHLLVSSHGINIIPAKKLSKPKWRVISFFLGSSGLRFRPFPLPLAF